MHDDSRETSAPFVYSTNTQTLAVFHWHVFISARLRRGDSAEVGGVLQTFRLSVALLGGRRVVGGHCTLFFCTLLRNLSFQLECHLALILK